MSEEELRAKLPEWIAFAEAMNKIHNDAVDPQLIEHLQSAMTNNVTLRSLYRSLEAVRVPAIAGRRGA